jgi:hypothetical protein
MVVVQLTSYNRFEVTVAIQHCFQQHSSIDQALLKHCLVVPTQIVDHHFLQSLLVYHVVHNTPIDFHWELSEMCCWFQFLGATKTDTARCTDLHNPTNNNAVVYQSIFYVFAFDVVALVLLYCRRCVRSLQQVVYSVAAILQ